MPLLHTTTPWILSAALLGSPLLGLAKTTKEPPAPPVQQGEMLNSTYGSGSYNSPARIDVAGGWDVYGTFDFTYWQASQDNMEWAYVDHQPTTVNIANGTVQKLPFSFEPGFQIGFGSSVWYDSWDLFAQYTWFRGTSTDKKSVDPQGTAENLQPLWGETGVPVSNGTIQAYAEGNTSWQCHMDIADVHLSRPFYEGKALTISPFFGLRSTWIRQLFRASYLTKEAPTVFTVQQKANSWAIGPRIGLDSHWLLGKGIRFFGMAGGDISYTQYTSLGRHATKITGGDLVRQVIMNEENLGTFRTHLDLDLGFGWGSYFHSNRWHLDLSAGYTFQVFFNQNMFVKNSIRNISSGTISANDTSLAIPATGNLYLQGLNLSVRADF